MKANQTQDGEHVRITSHLTTNHRRRVNQFIRGGKVGKGQHGEVFLCTDENNDGRQVVSNFIAVYIHKSYDDRPLRP